MEAETVLLQAGPPARGAGPCAGMPRPPRGPCRRPLLGLRRATTAAAYACAELGLDPWQDPHNHDFRFTRAPGPAPVDARPGGGARPRCGRGAGPDRGPACAPTPSASMTSRSRKARQLRSNCSGPRRPRRQASGRPARRDKNPRPARRRDRHGGLPARRRFPDRQARRADRGTGHRLARTAIWVDLPGRVRARRQDQQGVVHQHRSRQLQRRRKDNLRRTGRGIFAQGDPH